MIVAQGGRGFEQEFERLNECFRTVMDGDYSQVTDAEYRIAAQIIMDLNERVVGQRAMAA